MSDRPLLFRTEPFLGLWVDHRAAAFPRSCIGIEVHGIDLSTLESTAAGIITVYMQRGGVLDHYRSRVLKRMHAQLDEVVLVMEPPERGYFERLRRLCALVLEDVFGQQ